MAVRAGSLITVAGQVAWGLDDDVVGEDDSRAHSVLVFANLSQVLAPRLGGVQLLEVPDHFPVVVGGVADDQVAPHGGS